MSDLTFIALLATYFAALAHMVANKHQLACQASARPILLEYGNAIEHAIQEWDMARYNELCDARDDFVCRRAI